MISQFNLIIITVKFHYLCVHRNKSVVTGTDYTGSYKTIYHTITTTTAPPHTVRSTSRLMGVFDTIWDLRNETDNVSTRSRYVKLHTNRHDFMATTTLLNCNLLDFSLLIDHLYIPDLILRLYIFSCFCRKSFPLITDKCQLPSTKIRYISLIFCKF